MVFRSHAARSGLGPALLIPFVLLAALVAGCTTAQSGSATVGSTQLGSAQLGSTQSASTQITTPSGGPVTGSTEGSAGPTADTVVGWSSWRVELITRGVPSPTGDSIAQLAGNRVCFRPITGGASQQCGELAAGDRPSLVLFSPDGSRLLAVAGPDEHARAVYVVDAATGTVRVVGPGGVGGLAGEPARWDLSGVAWSADGSSVVVLPSTQGDTGPILAVDLATGGQTEIAQLPADLVNGKPSIVTAPTGLALVSHLSSERQAVWWVDAATKDVRAIARFDEPGGAAVVLTAADPLGRNVLACPWNADGSFGATVGIPVDGGQNGPILTDSTSCAGTVYSADGRYLAAAARLPSGYALTVTDLQEGRRVLTVPLPVAEPTMPPYLTWLGDTVVAADVSAHWPAPVVIHLLR